MVRCSYCSRAFRIGGLQEQLSKLYVHVIARHHQDASDNKQDWYREEADVNEAEEAPARPKRDAGDYAAEIKWALGAQGALVVVLRDGQAHCGVHGLTAQQLREVACVAVKASFDMQAQVANVTRLVKP